MTKNDIKLLKRFLKETKTYFPYLKNISIDDSYCPADVSVLEYWKEMHLEDAFDIAFDWDNTAEGFRFWDSIDCSWRDVIRYIKNGMTYIQALNRAGIGI